MGNDPQATVLGMTNPGVKPVLPDSKIGRAYGRILLEEKVGEGGMGEIYKGRHSGLADQVAVKFPTSKEKATLGRLLTEARSQHKLGKDGVPNILTIYDVVDDPEEPYIVMQYVENGIDLEKLILENQHDDPEFQIPVLKMLLEVFKTLHLAHTYKPADAEEVTPIIHRDVKPANILVVKLADGSYKVYTIDWGLARVGKGSNMTSDSTVMGSPLFMSPEQFRNADQPDPKADVFSAGLTLFYTVMGELFYNDIILEGYEKEGEQPHSHMTVVVMVSDWWNEPKRMKDRIAESPAWLQPILTKALQIQAKDRISMEELIKLTTEGIEQIGKPTKSKEENSFGKLATYSLLGVLVLIAAIVGIVQGFGGSDEGSKGKLNKVEQASVKEAPTMKADPVPERPKEKLRSSVLKKMPEGHVMPSDEYIQKLFDREKAWCLRNGYKHEEYKDSLTKFFGCMRKRVRKIYWSKHYGTGILLHDQVHTYFCFYPAPNHNALLKAECARSTSERKKYFNPVPGHLTDDYDLRLRNRMKIRNRIRAERKAWYKDWIKKRFHKKKSK